MRIERTNINAIVWMRVMLGRVPCRLRRMLKLVGLTVFLCVVLFALFDQVVFSFPTELLTRKHSTFVYSNNGRLLTAFTSEDRFWRKPVELKDISHKLISSVIATEDRYFYSHPGVNVVSLVKSAIANLQAGRVVRGGSTISMQISRMIEPKERTIRNKLFEIFRALQMELRYTKSELLGVYFNLVPYGGNIEGVGAASYFYFDKEPDKLSWSEAALLTAIPGSPEKLRPDKCLDCSRSRQEFVLARLHHDGVISSLDYKAALTEEIPSQRLQVPRHAPHLAVSLRSEYPEASLLKTTIRYNIQEVCERIARTYHQKYKAKGINNLAIVVIDNDKSEIMAVVGSPDFDDGRHSGQVDASKAARSPGSALKPFVYGVAFDLGTLSPEMMVPDIPVNYDGYRPVNYDESYRGLISVREALIHSLNIPAVNAAFEVGLEKLNEVLRRGQLTTIDKPYHYYGLPLILGAAEVRLTELTNLYAALARDGIFKRLKTLKSDENDAGLQLYSPEASYLLSEILVDLHRPDLPDSWRASVGNFPIAWKTGTSYGRRDAWTIGYTPRYSVGVWGGNCSGEGSAELVGASIAAPIMFEVMSEINRGKQKEWFEAPAGLSERVVCGVSGQPVGRFCDETTTEIFLIGISPAATCSVHRPVFVDRSTGMRLRASCTSGRDYDRKIVEIWPPRIASWLVNNDMSAPLAPYDPECFAGVDGQNPSIISPEDGAVFEIAYDLPLEYQKIRLQASIASGDGTVHWFLDGKHLRAVEAGEVTFYMPVKGRHKLLCVDDAGRSSTAIFQVN